MARTRTSIRTKVTMSALAGVLALGTGVLAAGPAQAADSFGCPSGAVCIYKGTNWYEPVPWNQRYTSAGVHQLYNQEGQHIVYNNQTGGWTVKLCRNSNGTDCLPKMRPGDGWPENLSPINSIVIATW